jgi:putative ABC transport system ATP-binding protein
VLSALNDAGRTVVIITHEQEIARFAKRVVRLRDGHIDTDQSSRTGRRPMREPGREYRTDQVTAITVGVTSSTST